MRTGHLQFPRLQALGSSADRDLAACPRVLEELIGLKRRRSARILAAGQAFLQNIRRGHYELATDVPPATDLRSIRPAHDGHLTACLPVIALCHAHRSTSTTLPSRSSAFFAHPCDRK
jgi:hypothetical protein